MKRYNKILICLLMIIFLLLIYGIFNSVSAATYNQIINSQEFRALPVQAQQKLLEDFDITYKKVADTIGIDNNIQICEEYLLDFLELADSVKDSSAKIYTRDLFGID